MSVENETPQEGGGTSHSEEAHAERAASANAFEKIYFKLSRNMEGCPKFALDTPIFYPALTGSKTPTSRLEEAEKRRWEINCS